MTGVGIAIFLIAISYFVMAYAGYLSINGDVEINVNGKNAELIGARKKLLDELKRIRN